MDYVEFGRELGMAKVAEVLLPGMLGPMMAAHEKIKKRKEEEARKAEEEKKAKKEGAGGGK